MAVARRALKPGVIPISSPESQGVNIGVPIGASRSGPASDHPGEVSCEHERHGTASIRPPRLRGRVSSVGFKRLWPNTPDPSPSSATALSGGRQLTTDQIARGVFWGMWLFTLSQVILGAIVMFVALAVTGSAISSLS